MSSSLLHPPAHLPPATALQLSQQAPTLLQNSTGAVATSTLQSLLASPETAELWTIYENLVLSCLRTGDQQSAHECLSRLSKRFGDDNERIMALKGLIQEAGAEDNASLQVILKEYDQILAENPTNLPITKRRVALLSSLGRASEAVAAVIALLDFSPTDAEAWSELADLYYSQGLHSQAIYALEEVLVLQPNAWNVHARLGELLYVASKASAGPESMTQLNEALKRFCRSIELCDDYLRGYYGLKVVVQQLLKEPSKSLKQANSEDLSLPELDSIKKLDELATEKLAEIVRRQSAGERGWQGYDPAEIAAARELLGESVPGPK